MIKIEPFKAKDKMEIYLPEEWHEKLELSTGKQKLPYRYEYMEEIKSDQKLFLFRGNKNKKDYEIVVSESVLRYLNGNEVPDSNTGFSFKEYLPLEDSHILISNIKNPLCVNPATVKLECCLMEYAGKAYILLDFMIRSLNENPHVPLSYYTGYSRGMWKFLFYEDTSYMNDYEKMFRDTYIHKSFVEKSCKKLADYLFSKNINNHAHKLLERAKVHDNSKVMCDDELHIMASIINDKGSLSDANKSLGQIKKDAIKLHWKHNCHHPEHFKNHADMERIDLMEMVCDWHARSVQYGTDLIEFVKVRQEERFHFPQYMFDEIMFYCIILTRD